jgi:hypothetical protein
MTTTVEAFGAPVSRSVVDEQDLVASAAPGENVVQPLDERVKRGYLVEDR